MREAKSVIAESERIILSERDSLMVVNLLENPPASNAKLRAAIAAMPKPTRKRVGAFRSAGRADLKEA